MDFAVFKLYYIFLHLYFGVFIQEKGTEGGHQRRTLNKNLKLCQGGGGGSGGSLYSERVAC